MLKEACAISALVAAAVVPSAAQAKTAETGAVSAPAVTSLGHCASGGSAPCKWMSEGDRRCFYCKQSKKKGGGWKRQYCEQRHRDRGNRGPRELECTTAAAPTQAQPKRTCETCVDARTGRQVSRKCSSG